MLSYVTGNLSRFSSFVRAMSCCLDRSISWTHCVQGHDRLPSWASSPPVLHQGAECRRWLSETWRCTLEDSNEGWHFSQEWDLLTVPGTAEHLRHPIFPSHVAYADGDERKRWQRSTEQPVAEPCSGTRCLLLQLQSLQPWAGEFPFVWQRFLQEK